MTPLISTPASRLHGRLRAPGDKSVSHRALMLGAAAVGPTVIRGLLESRDVLHTADALRALGAGVAREPDGAWRVDGVGVGGLMEPARVLDLGNSGTGLRLLMGLVATHPFATHFAGDESLSRRPLDRIARPLARMGARAILREESFLPAAVLGAAEPVPVTYRLPVPSAQVKSAVLLAGLNAPGETTVIEPAPTRDHTEILLRHFGAEVAVTPAEEGPGAGGRRITLAGQPELAGRPVTVAGDPSSAAFAVVAALIVPGSEVTVEGVGVNALRMGLYHTLTEMGADIALANAREEGGEPVADVTARAGALSGIEVPAERAPAMIDEYPALAAAAAFARGPTVMRGLSELRLKESDRVAAIARGLAACGVRVRAEGDTLTVEGDGGPPAGGARVAAQGDHRIAMAFLALGCGARAPVTVDDGDMIETSFPGFAEAMNALGASIRPAEARGAAP